ncbi:hypothetical protein SCUCBS95973_009557 [Sporothrix curviconia]|uniref:Uncharacterized protein n=1 Tax=Sporothrix curviconia TaxID=1260050 RepID=A0ABP0CWI2_9PEZI
MPRLFGRSQTPTPAQGHGRQPAETHSPAPRAKLVRRTGDHFSPLAGHSGYPGPSGPSRPSGPLASTDFLHREGSLASASASAYEVLLNGPDRSSLCGSSIRSGSQHQYYAVRSQWMQHRSWLAAADARQPSWSSERPPPRKLVKDPGGSARPSAAREIPDEDGGDPRHKATGSRGQAASGSGSGSGSRSGHEKSSSGGPGTLGIRRKISRWRDLRW